MGQRILAACGCLLMAACWWASLGCSGDVRSPTLEGNLLSYPSMEMVTYDLVGTASCAPCTKDDRFIGFNLEIAMKDDPIHIIKLVMVDALGPFTIEDLRTVAGAVLTLRGTLYREGAPESEALLGYTEVKAPDEEGKTVSAVLNFPSQEPTE